MQKSVILLNMGGPNNLDEVKLFLTNMFNDKNIIAAPSPIRKMIAWFITQSRLSDAQKSYAELGGMSPIIQHTEKLVNALASTIDAKVDYAMRYTPPFVGDVLERHKQSDAIYAIPLYPHYSKTTTNSSLEDLYTEAKKLGIEDKIHTVTEYYKHPLYIDSIIARITEALGDRNPSEYELVFSAHGLPQKIIDQGDSYQRHIRYTLHYARKALMLKGINFHKTHLAYQSRLGPMEWIRPYLEDKLETLTKKRVIVFPIAFTVDNSETKYELDIEYCEVAEELELEEYIVTKAPNDHPKFVEALGDIYQSMEVECV